MLTGFTRGNEWKTLWVPQPGTWEVVDAALTQTSAGRSGTLAIADPQYRSDYVVAAQFQPSEAVMPRSRTLVP